MISEGRVSITLSRQSGQPAMVSFQQPGDIGRVVHGKLPGEALKILPRLYSVCGTAQGHAAALCLEQASGIIADPQTATARTALTAMETLREHVLRIACDWPSYYSGEPHPAEVSEVMKLGPALKVALFGPAEPFAIAAKTMPDSDAAASIIAQATTLIQAYIFAEPPQQWLTRRGLDEISAWAANAGTPAAQLIDMVIRRGWLSAGSIAALPLRTPPSVKIAEWLASGDDEVILLPAADTPETTLFTRNINTPLLASLGGDGIGARLLARLVELARLPERLRMLVGNEIAPPLPSATVNGIGVGLVEAARGHLIHAVSLEQGRISAYSILPPSRWNFDARGVAARSLSQLDASVEDDRLVQAQLLINAIDPCVAHEVRFA
ncbi:MAG: nickel-dependent hydrogenase large subunit, partial [Alphaproteobacteria bacterium]